MGKITIVSVIYENVAVKHGAILCNEAEVFSLSITNPNRRPMLPFDWLIHLSLILASASGFCFCAGFLRLRNKLKTNIRKKIQTDCEGNFNYDNMIILHPVI